MENLRTLRQGDRTPQTDLLQTALSRAGFPANTDGVFGAETFMSVQSFQAARGLTRDGIVGSQTWQALLPFLTGYIIHTVEQGDTMYKLASASGGSVMDVQTANPGVDPLNLQPGTQIVIPLWFDVVPVNIRWSSIALAICADGLAARYPFITFRSVGRSVMGRELLCAQIGRGSHQVFYNASHHANEWITTPVLMKFLEDYAKARAASKPLAGIGAETLYAASTLYLMPMVNPDGVDLVTGEITSGRYYERAAEIARRFPSIPFPGGWKANIEGVDLNLQYPAMWERAREIKFAQGFTRPAPRDYVGSAPLTAPESRAAAEFTLSRDFMLTLSYHTQGKVIYWKYLNMEPLRSREIGEHFAKLSGYALELTPPESAFAGYKDWFIQTYDRPGYTIEAGIGVSPLPIEQFGDIYQDNLGILTHGLTANK